MKWLFLLLLTGCSTVPVDGVIPIKWHKTDKAWLEASKFMPVTRSDMFSMQGGSFWDGKVCHVFAPDPKMKEVAGKKFYTENQWAILGHEVKHCFDGAFHKDAIKE